MDCFGFLYVKELCILTGPPHLRNESIGFDLVESPFQFESL